MRSHLFQHTEPEGEPGSFQLANKHMLKVDLTGSGGFFYAKQGSMVAYQGDVGFDYEGSGSVTKLFKKAFTGEGMSLMKVSGRGDVFLAQDADEVFVLYLENESVTVSGANILAFESTLTWDINRVKGAGIATGGFFNTTLTGTGTAAVTVVGHAMVLDCSQQPVYVDPQSSVCWSGNLTPSVQNSMNMKSMMRGGSGEAIQYAFHGPGFVVVQAYEWKPPPANNSGGGGLIKNVTDLIP